MPELSTSAFHQSYSTSATSATRAESFSKP